MDFSLNEIRYNFWFIQVASLFTHLLIRVCQSKFSFCCCKTGFGSESGKAIKGFYELPFNAEKHFFKTLDFDVWIEAIHENHLFLDRLCVRVFFVNTWNEMRGVRAEKIDSSRDTFGFIWPEIIIVDEFTSIKNSMWIHLYFHFFFLSFGLFTIWSGRLYITKACYRFALTSLCDLKICDVLKKSTPFIGFKSSESIQLCGCFWKRSNPLKWVVQPHIKMLMHVFSTTTNTIDQHECFSCLFSLNEYFEWYAVSVYTKKEPINFHKPHHQPNELLWHILEYLAFYEILK